MASEMDAFRDKFLVEALSVASTEQWELSVRPQQLTLGSMVLSVRSNVLDFASLNQDQCREMGALLGVAEERVKERFGAVRINVLCLMMQDPLLHFHVFPRYKAPVSFEGEEWVDADWPGPPSIRSTEQRPDINRALLAALRMSPGV